MVSYSGFFQDVADYGILPDPDQFIFEAKDLAWPQILAFSSAVIGVLVVVLIFRSFRL